MQQHTMRPIDLQVGFLQSVKGSVLVSFGGTRVLCTATLQKGAPPFQRERKMGWLTAEYAMLPASTQQRKTRAGAKPDGRAVEIQRLIGRSLRAAVDLSLMEDFTISIDCDVLEADGGTRTASITGAFVALTAGVAHWVEQGLLVRSPIVQAVAAVSVGLVEDAPILDLDYAHDSNAQVDMNVVMTGDGRLVEVQGTGETRSFSKEELYTLVDLAKSGIDPLFALQKVALGESTRYVKGWSQPLVVATANLGKVREMQDLLGVRYTHLLSMQEAGIQEQAVEDGSTFEENAVIKAEHAMRASGLMSIADDSGLEVDALQGAPGIYSARYAGEHSSDQENLALLLMQLQDVQTNLSARFVCALALARPGLATLVVRGTVEGEMTLTPRGQDGFGYDPAFVALGDEKTFAELTKQEKNKRSHRAKAVTLLLAKLAEEDKSGRIAPL